MRNPNGELRYYANTLDVALNLSIYGEGGCIQADLYKGVSAFHLTNDCESTSITNSLLLAPGSYWGIKPAAEGGSWRTAIVAMGSGITWDTLGWDRPAYSVSALTVPEVFNCEDMNVAEAAALQKLDGTGLGHLVSQMKVASFYFALGNSWAWYRLERWRNGAYEFVQNFKSATYECEPNPRR